MMTQIVRPVFLYSVISLGFLSCSQKENASTKPLQLKPRQNSEAVGIGKVVSVNSEQGFILIKVSKVSQVKNQTQLYTKGSDRTSSLMLTGEKIGRYIAADVTAGSVKLGDTVHARTARSFLLDDDPTAEVATERKDSELNTKATGDEVVDQSQIDPKKERAINSLSSPQEPEMNSLKSDDTPLPIKLPSL